MNNHLRFSMYAGYLLFQEAWFCLTWDDFVFFKHLLGFVIFCVFDQWGAFVDALGAQQSEFILLQWLKELVKGYGNSFLAANATVELDLHVELVTSTGAKEPLSIWMKYENWDTLAAVCHVHNMVSKKFPQVKTGRNRTYPCCHVSVVRPMPMPLMPLCH